MSRAIPADHLAYPIHVALSSGSQGSAFFIFPQGVVFLITAKHVLFGTAGQLLADEIILTCPALDPSEQATTCYKVNLGSLQAAGQLHQHPTRDVAAVHFATTQQLPESKNFTLIHNPGITLQSSAKSGIVGVQSGGAKLLSDVLVGNPVILFGYPSSLGLRKQPQFDYTRPLLRNGIVAGKYPQQGTLILDCPVFPGNSGGPVVEIEQEGFTLHYRVIGVATEFIPLVETTESKLYGYKNTSMTNSGYSVAVAMDAVFEMLKLPLPGAAAAPA